jgi:long-subunit acyl-CoA synthetase (AMP-forming)
VNNPFGVSSLCQAFQRSAAVDPGGVALRTPGGAVEITWRAYAERVRRIAGGLAALGVRRGHTVALMMTNRPEFNLCDTAAMHLGATPFSVYNTLAAEQITHLFDNAENRVVICEAAFAERAAAAGGKVEHVICVDGHSAGRLSVEDIEGLSEPGFDFDGTWRAVGSDDVLTLIYTSGTTGPPKGVEITHANMLAEIAATSSVLPVTGGDRIASYLPSAHVADRWSSHYQQLVFGLQVTCVADIRTIAAALVDIRPTLWGAVPRVWEKIKAALEARIETEPDPQRRQALQAAIATGLRKVRA